MDERKSLWAVFSLALVLRLASVWSQGPAFVKGDALQFNTYAVHLSQEGRYVGPNDTRASRVPGYPLFLAAVYSLFGESTLAVVLLQCLIGAWTCVLLYGLARTLLPPPWPLFCGLSAAVYYDMVTPAGWIVAECLYSFFLVLAMRALFARTWPPERRALLFGAGLGCVVVIRPELLPFCLFGACLLPWSFPSFRRKEALLALVGPALIMGLWTGRNYLVMRRFIPGTTMASNTQYAALYNAMKGSGRPVGEMIQPSVDLPELERSRIYSAAYADFRARYGLFQVLKARLYNLSAILYPFLPAYDFTYAMLLPFWLLGMAISLTRRTLWPIAGPVIFSLSAFTIWGGGESRYRFGISPLLIILAGVGLDALSRAISSRRLSQLTSAWVALNLLICFFAPQFRQAALWLKAALIR